MLSSSRCFGTACTRASSTIPAPKSSCSLSPALASAVATDSLALEWKVKESGPANASAAKIRTCREDLTEAVRFARARPHGRGSTAARHSPSQFATIILTRAQPRCTNCCSCHPVNFLNSVFEPFFDCAAASAGSDSNFDVFCAHCARCRHCARWRAFGVFRLCCGGSGSGGGQHGLDAAAGVSRPAQQEATGFAGPLPKPRIAARWSPLHTSGTPSRRGLGVGGCSSPPPVPHGTGRAAIRRSPLELSSPTPSAGLVNVEIVDWRPFMGASPQPPAGTPAPLPESAWPAEKEGGREAGRQGGRESG